MLKTFQQRNFSLEFPEILSQMLMLLLTELALELKNNALWGTFQHTIYLKQCTLLLPIRSKSIVCISLLCFELFDVIFNLFQLFSS